MEKEKENVHALPKDSGVPNHANVTTVEISFKLAVFPLHQAQEEREGELPFQPQETTRKIVYGKTESSSDLGTLETARNIVSSSL